METLNTYKIKYYNSIYKVYQYFYCEAESTNKALSLFKTLNDKYILKTIELVKLMKKGDKVVYTYEHFLNSKSSTIISKKGVFVRFLDRKNKDMSNDNLRCVVRFPENRCNSIVYFKKVKAL